MIPLLPSFASLPAGKDAPRSAANGSPFPNTSQESGTTSHGGFSELFAALLRGAGPLGGEASPSRDTESTTDVPANENVEPSVSDVTETETPNDESSSAETMIGELAPGSLFPGQLAQYAALMTHGTQLTGTGQPAEFADGGALTTESVSTPVTGSDVALGLGSTLEDAPAARIGFPAGGLAGSTDSVSVQDASAFKLEGPDMATPQIGSPTLVGPADTASDSLPTGSRELPAEVPATTEAQSAGGEQNVGVAPGDAAPNTDVDVPAPLAAPIPANQAARQNALQVAQPVPAQPVSAAAGMPPAPNDFTVGGVGVAVSPRVEGVLASPHTPPPLHRQLAGPITTIATGPHGERTLSVNIAPEALGPITVKAHLGGEGLRVDLSAPTDAGSEALRAMLPELRRELAATGAGSITVSAGGDANPLPGGHAGQQQTATGDHRPPFGTGRPPMKVPGEELPEPLDRDTAPAQPGSSHLDVMA